MPPGTSGTGMPPGTTSTGLWKPAEIAQRPKRRQRTPTDALSEAPASAAKTQKVGVEAEEIAVEGAKPATMEKTKEKFHQLGVRLPATSPAPLAVVCRPGHNISIP